MLTPAERNSLLLSLTFLALGAGIKAWKKWRVEIGPFDPAAAASAPLDQARTGNAPAALLPDSLPPDTSHAIAPRADSSRVSAADVPLAESRKPARRGPVKPAKSPPLCPMDANLAREDQLANLPGVGPRTAAALAAYRKEKGPFREIRELLEVKGIGEKKLALIAPCLILSGAVANPAPAQAGVNPQEDGEAGSGGH